MKKKSSRGWNRRFVKRPFIERLEDRLALAVYTVDSALDVESSTDGVLTFREAIILANQDSAQDTIRFAISGGPSVITLQSALPTLSESVIINGWSQNGSDDPSAPTVELSGEGLTGSEDGLVITGQGVSILGLVIRDFGGYGVRIESLVPGGAGSATLEGNFIGTDVTGHLRRSNSLGGVLIQDSSVNVIGGVGAYRGNVISGNGGAGVTIRGSGEIQIDPSTAWDLPSLLSGSGNENSATRNRVIGNVIGLSADGSGPLGNASHGVWLDRAGGNVIGGFAPGEGNTISGNGRTMGLEGAEDLDAQSNADGIRVTGAALDLNAPVDSTEAAWNVISGNRIGVDATGMVSFGVGGVSLLGNTGSGIQLGDLSESLAIRANGGSADLRVGPKHTLIGVLPTSEGALGASNVIGGNDGDGVRVDGPGVRYDDSSNPTLPLTLNAVIAGNMIGVNAAGLGALGNQGSGVRLLAGAQLNQVGGSIVAERNIISGNGENGVAIVGTSELVSRSVVGDAGEDGPYTVVTTGPVLTADGPDHVLFTLVIDSTSLVGEAIYTSVSRMVRDPLHVGELTPLRTEANLIQGNYIGTDVTGLVAIGNDLSGVLIAAGVYLTSIGSYYQYNPGPTPDLNFGAGNIISGNGRHGVEIRGIASFTNSGVLIDAADHPIDSDTNFVLLQQNLIGLGADGQTGLGNAHDGIIATEGARAIFIGLTVRVEGALFDAPLSPGQQLSDLFRNVVSGNGGNGITISGTDRDPQTITDPIEWFRSVTGSNFITSNFVGSNATGDAAVGNLGSGIVVEQGARSTNIGGLSTVGEPVGANLVVGNGGNGVLFRDTYGPASQSPFVGPMTMANQDPSHSSLRGNYIGVNKNGVVMGNGGDGVALINAMGVDVGSLALEGGNVISGNAGYGVRLSGADATRNVISGNYIGLDPRSVPELNESPIIDSPPIGNGLGGVIFEAGAHDNRFSYLVSGAYVNYKIGNYYLAGIVALESYQYLRNRFISESVEIPGYTDPYNYEYSGPPDEVVLNVTEVPFKIMVVRNIIQSTVGAAVLLTGVGTTGNHIESAYIGTDPLGNILFAPDGSPLLSGAGAGIVETGGASGNFVGSDEQDEVFYSRLVTQNPDGAISISVDPETTVYVTLSGLAGDLVRRNIVAVDGVAGAQPWTHSSESGVGNFAGGDYSLGAGGAVILDASAAPTTLGPNTYAWDLDGDGQFDDATGAAPTLTWSQWVSLGGAVTPSTHPIWVRVTDARQNIGYSQAQLSIVNTTPTASAGGPYVVSEGGSLHLDASASADPDVGQSLTYTWDVNGDGVYGDATGVTPTLNWAALAALGVGDGPSGFSVHVRVFDGLATTTSSAGSLTVQNSPPTAHIEIPVTPIVRGAPTSVTFSVTDASAADQAASFTYHIDWNNDGIDDEVVAGAGSGVAVSHVFAAAGDQTIAVKAVDKDGGVSAAATNLVSVVAYAQVGGDLYIGGSSGDDFYGFWGLGGHNIGVVTNDIGVFLADGVTGQIYLFMQDGNDTATTNFGVNGFHFTVDMGLGANIFAPVSGGGNTFLYYGGSGVDQFFLNAGPNNTVVFHGGGGDDVFLDVSGDASNSVTVHGDDGNDGAAVGPGAAYLEGNNGNDMLISFGGGATMLGGAGDDFLVSGPNPGSLTGDAGNDLLVAGALVYLPEITDGYLPIWAEWGSSGNSFATRVAHISGTPGGLNGDYYITPGSTALDNGAVDTILGGADADWLVYNFAQDLAPDYAAGVDSRLGIGGV